MSTASNRACQSPRAFMWLRKLDASQGKQTESLDGDPDELSTPQLQQVPSHGPALNTTSTTSSHGCLRAAGRWNERPIVRHQRGRDCTRCPHTHNTHRRDPREPCAPPLCLMPPALTQVNARRKQADPPAIHPESHSRAAIPRLTFPVTTACLVRVRHGRRGGAGGD